LGRTYPRGFRLESGAYVLLSVLEDSDAAGELSETLPSASEVIESVRRQLHDAPQAYWTDDSRGEELFGKVLKAWERYSWPLLGHVNVAVARPNQEPLLELLADFLWSNRHLGAEVASELTDAKKNDPKKKRSLFDCFSKKNRHSKRK
jgi:hypothetical protein